MSYFQGVSIIEREKWNPGIDFFYNMEAKSLIKMHCGIHGLVGCQLNFDTTNSSSVVPDFDNQHFTYSKFSRK